jgi:hypothetical protein
VAESPKAVHDVIAAAERILPGKEAPEGELDPRWQAIIEVGEFIETAPEEVWAFILRWGSHPDEDLRAAIATCLLEHLLDADFERFFPLVEERTLQEPLFADTFTKCWKFGQSRVPHNTARFDALRRRLGRYPGL